MTREERLSLWATRFLRLLFATLRVRVTDEAGVLRQSPDFPLIFTFWHNRILAITPTFLRHYPGGRRGVSVLTSPSRDGEILARVVGHFGMGSVRGSSSRRGFAAVRECLQILEQGADLAITPDGPRGPRYQMGPGLVLLLQQSNARMVPTHARFHSALRLKTWDHFTIPLPFSRIDVTIGPYQTAAPTNSEAEFEQERARLEEILRQGTASP
jgi:lysophospholipid acyltransferase (LPLAT)-like uncharacterized protein